VVENWPSILEVLDSTPSITIKETKFRKVVKDFKVINKYLLFKGLKIV
jgi:hypothetical protein